MRTAAAATEAEIKSIGGAAWLSEPSVQVAAIIAIATTLKLALCPFVGLGVNEAYAIASGRSMSLSYLDHPPLHLWLAHGCELLLGYSAAARIPFILLGAATSWMMFVLARDLFGPRAGVWTVAALNTSIFFNLVSGNWMLPDGPLNFFLLATAFTLAPTALGRSLSMGRWAVAGLLAGTAALSKYHALLFLAGYLAFLLLDRDHRRMLLQPGPWIAAALALAVFSPVLIWNASHGWISLRFQGGRAVPHHLGISLFFSLLCAQIAVLLPGALVPLLAGTRNAAISRRSEEMFLLCLGFPTVALFTFIPLITDKGMMHWAMPGWLMLMPLAGKYLDDRSRISRRPLHLLGSTAAVLLVATLGAGLEYQTGWLGKDFPRLFKRGDPTADNASWSALAPVLSDSNRKFILTSTWRDAAEIDEAIGGKDRVIVATDDPRNFAVGLHPQTFENANGWIVLRTTTSNELDTAVRNCFGYTAHTANVVIARNERPDASLTVFRGDRFAWRRCKLVTFRR